MMDQKESENISDNLRWSIDMRMRTGKYNACFAPFGYQLVGGKLELILEQAPIIRYIYDAYLAGKTAEDVGAPAQPVVRAGDRVEKGALIAAAPEGKLGANLHASIAGTVTAVTEREITIQQ